MRLPPRPALKTETNTPAMGQRVLSSARAFFRRRDIVADFEHGQWWVTFLRTGEQYSVDDAEGGDSINGFSFEQVTAGEEQDNDINC